MCGIVSKIWHKPVDSKDGFNDIINIFDAQRSRGTQGMGLVAIFKDRTVQRMRSDSEDGLLEKMYKVKGDLMGVMFHHRYPTSTVNIENCAHPILVSNKELDNDYYVVHNGVINYTNPLKKKHEELGYTYETEYTVKTSYAFKRGRVKEWTGAEETAYNDSETLAIEVARYLENKQDLLDLSGSYAVVVLEVDKKTKKAKKLHYFRNDKNPLINDGTGLLCLRSQKGNVCGFHQGGVTSDSIAPFRVNTLDLVKRTYQVETLKHTSFIPQTYGKKYGTYQGGTTTKDDDYGAIRYRDNFGTTYEDLEDLAELNAEIDSLYDDLEESGLTKDERKEIHERIKELVAERELYTRVVGL